mgnify:CR=1 FL=1
MCSWSSFIQRIEIGCVPHSVAAGLQYWPMWCGARARKAGYAWRYSGCRHITDYTFIKVLSMVGHTITRMDISCCAKLSDASLRAVATLLAGSLHHLSIALCSLIGDIGIAAVANGCKRVAIFWMSPVLPSPHMTLQGSLPQWRHCIRYDVVVFLAWRMLLHELLLFRAPQLQLLDLSNSSIGDVAVGELATRCLHLRSLDISVTRVTDSGIARWPWPIFT